MINKIQIVLTVMLCGTFGPAKASLFSDSISLPHLEDVKRTQPWLQSSNPAGHFVLSETFSEAAVSFQKQNGGFVNYHESDDNNTWTAQAASYTRLNARTVVSGAIEYKRFTGRHMGGSAFIDPYHTPFDIVDYDVNNRGKKQLETYHLYGAAAYDLTSRWTLGAKFDYTTGNYAKQKDLRHVNDLMNLQTSVGVAYRTAKWDAGIDYVYHKRSEGLGFGTFGTTEETYNSLISYGGFWGIVEQFGGYDGYTGKTDEKPMVDKYHGGALQFNWKPLSKVSLYNEFAFFSRKGYYGIPSTHKITYSNHDSQVLKYTGQLNICGRRGQHHLRWTYDRETLNNDENIYRYETVPGGLDQITYYGSMETLKRTVQNFGIAYTGYFGRVGQSPLWTVEGGYRYHSRDSKASFYPFYRKQDLHTSTVYLSGEYHWYRKLDNLNFRLGTSFATGGGNKAVDNIYAPPSSSQKPPKNSPYYLNQEFEYLTATQMRHQVGVEYVRKLAKAPIKLTGGLTYRLAHAFDTQFVQEAHQHSLSLHVGCIF